MKDGLPQGWATCQVQDVYESFGGGTPNKGNATFWGGKIPWLSSGDIKSRRITSSSDSITKTGLENSSAHLCRAGSVLIVVRSGILKHSLPIAILEREASINQDIKCFDSGDDALNEWLILALRSSERQILTLNREGTTVQSVKYETLKEFELPVPPLNEQRRIVAKLENILGKVDACQKRLERIPVILKRFRQSVLAAACSGRLTEDWRESSKSQINGEDLLENIYKERIGLCKTTEERRHIEHCVANARCNKSMFANGWIKLNAELLCDFITKGTTPRSKDEKPEIPFLKVYNIVDNKINFEHKPQFVSRKTHETSLKRSVVYPGDVLMNIVGPPLCKVAIVPPTFPEWNVNQAIGIFRPVSSLRSQFLYIALLGSEDLRRIISETRGIVGQSNISLQQCRDLEISIPACAEQDEIVRRVENLFKFADQIEVQYQKAKAHVDKLNQSVLAKAFRGELVPQDPDDEPADVLLERIRRGKGKVDTAAN